MADYLMWPFLERLKIHIQFDLTKLPVLSAYIVAMSELPAVKADSYPVEWHKKYMEGFLTGNPEVQLIGIEEKA